MRKDYDDEMFADPDPSGENSSPEFLNEVFQMFEALGYTPESIAEPKERRAYAKWLKKRDSQTNKARRKL